MHITSYNAYSRWLHWAIAGLILFMVILGFRIGDHDSLLLARVSLHKSIGILILAASLARIGLRLAYKAPPEPAMPQWQAFAARGLHLLFYVVMIGMPLTGWAMVSTSVRPVPFFGLFNVPHLPVPQNSGVHDVFEGLHGLIAKLLIFGMIPLHVLAALKHQFIDKDSLFDHMVPGLKSKPALNWRWIVPAGTVLLAIGLGYGLLRGKPESAATPSAPPAPPPSATSDAAQADSDASDSPSSSQDSSAVQPVTTWLVDKGSTKIAFSTTFQGEAVTGAFGNFTANIRFDAAQLDRSRVKVSIDLSSVRSGDADRDTTLKSDAFFNIAATPKAIFEARSFTQEDATHFVAHGQLTLHGVSHPQDLPFTLVIKHGVAQMTATAAIDRTSFGVGSGEWSATDTVPAKVKVDITLKASEKP